MMKRIRPLVARICPPLPRLPLILPHKLLKVQRRKRKKAALAGGDNQFDTSKLMEELNDPEFAKTLDETLKLFQAAEGEGKEAAGEFGDDEIASTLKALAEAGNGLEGADASQAEQLGEDIMAQMMKSFEGMSNKGDFQDMIDGMMKQLISKEVMYEPVKQICEKFPEWLADNEPKLEKEEYTRYGNQYQSFQKLLAVYDTEPDNFARLTELYQDMQEYGQPPVEIVKELAPGLDIGEDGVPVMPGLGAPGMLPPGLKPDQGCAQQ
mmetsp:Transcript_9858/g.15673  ORF Transcript_9858/g.15673 Transcript_9858/m.15673 type:complete len:266 (+) Transcript_9858:103-900(+)